MRFDLENPYQTLVKAGYVMDGESNSFRFHMGETFTYKRSWYHAIVQLDGKQVALHLDKSKYENWLKARSKHITIQDTHEVRKEAVRISALEKKTVTKRILNFIKSMLKVAKESKNN